MQSKQLDTKMRTLYKVMCFLALSICMPVSASVDEVTTEPASGYQEQPQNQPVVNCHPLDDDGNLSIDIYQRDLDCNTIMHFKCEGRDELIHGRLDPVEIRTRQGSTDTFPPPVELSHNDSAPCEMDVNKNQNCSSITLIIPICHRDLNTTTFKICGKCERLSPRNRCSRTIQFIFFDRSAAVMTNHSCGALPMNSSMPSDSSSDYRNKSVVTEEPTQGACTNQVTTAIAVSVVVSFFVGGVSCGLLVLICHLVISRMKCCKKKGTAPKTYSSVSVNDDSEGTEH